MGMLQRALQFFQRNVRVLMDQFDQEIVEGRQAATPGLAAVRGGGKADTLPELQRSREADAADIISRRAISRPEKPSSKSC